MKESETHVNMFLAAVDSPVMKDKEVTELYDLMVKSYDQMVQDRESKSLLLGITQHFYNKRTAAIMDYFRKRLSELNSDDYRMLVRQLEDPETDQDALLRTMKVMESGMLFPDYLAMSGMVSHLRPDVIDARYIEWRDKLKIILEAAMDIVERLDFTENNPDPP